MELLFEGDVTTDDSGYFVLGSVDGLTRGFQGGDTVYWTVNGVTEVVTAKQSSMGGWFGNEFLLGDTVDTGYDYYVGTVVIAAGAVEGVELYFRNPGTYAIKLEVIRAVIPEYSYNGTILGTLPPDWDSEQDPYAFIKHGDENRYEFYAYPMLPTFTAGDDGFPNLVWEEKPQAQTADVYTNLSLWWEDIEMYIWYFVLNSHNGKDVIWANFDIYNADGTIYLKASDPIPVGGEPIDPTSMLMGWQIGARIAGMRK